MKIKSFILVLALAGCLNVVLGDDIFTAAMHGDVEKLKFMIEKYPDLLNKTSDAGANTPLILAAAWIQADSVKCLLDKKANVNWQNQHKAGNQAGGATALHSAVYETQDVYERRWREMGKTDFKPSDVTAAQVEIVKMLLAAHADANITMEHGWTPLHLAAKNGYIEAAELLLKNKVSVNVLDKDKNTPMKLAAINGHVELAKLIEKNGGK